MGSASGIELIKFQGSRYAVSIECGSRRVALTLVIRTTLSVRKMRLESLIRRPLDLNNSFHADLCEISNYAAWLLEQEDLTGDVKDLRQRYLTAFIDRGYATFSGNVRTKQLVQDFKSRFPHDFLSSIGCELEGRHRRNWLARISQSAQIQHPIRHLLVIRFLNYSVQEFFSLSLTRKPFGDSPWKCLNPICEYSGQDVIHQITITYSQKMNHDRSVSFVVHTAASRIAGLVPIRR